MNFFLVLQKRFAVLHAANPRIRALFTIWQESPRSLPPRRSVTVGPWACRRAVSQPINIPPHKQQLYNYRIPDPINKQDQIYYI